MKSQQLTNCSAQWFSARLGAKRRDVLKFFSFQQLDFLLPNPVPPRRSNKNAAEFHFDVEVRVTEPLGDQQGQIAAGYDAGHFFLHHVFP